MAVIGSDIICGVLVNKVRLLDESLGRSLRLPRNIGFTWESSNSLSLNAVPSWVGPSVLLERSEISQIFMY